jgi:protein-S-isoprenylcysteine O-methyltransferase Ste14
MPHIVFQEEGDTGTTGSTSLMQIIEPVFIALWAVFFAYWILSAMRDRSPFKRQSSRSAWFTCMAVPIAVVLAVTVLLAPWLLEARVLPGTLPFALAGLAVTCAGLGFAVMARVHLGKNWSGRPAIREDHTITRTGPYALVRHPIYTGLLTAVLGTAIATGSLTAFFVMFVILLSFVIKIRMEEQFLLEEFGDEYARYRREVKALIPFVV